MTLRQKRRNRAGGRGFETANVHVGGRVHCSAPRSLRDSPRGRRPLPPDWEDRLPSPRAYYQRYLGNLRSAGGELIGHCPVHDVAIFIDPWSGSFSRECQRGSGTMVSFHMEMTGLPFHDAVLDLPGGDA